MGIDRMPWVLTAHHRSRPNGPPYQKITLTSDKEIANRLLEFWSRQLPQFKWVLEWDDRD